MDNHTHLVSVTTGPRTFQWLFQCYPLLLGVQPLPGVINSTVHVHVIRVTMAADLFVVSFDTWRVFA